MGHPRATATLWAAIALVAGCTSPAAQSDDDVPHTPDTPAATTAVARQDLTASDEVAGSLGYENPVPLVASRDGIVTWMPGEGTVIQPGEVVGEINGAATRLLIGERPAWRDLAVGVPAGPDMRQLNDNLAALGYAERGALPGDGFDWRTRQAVSRWQRDRGLPRTGALEAGDVVFLPSVVRVGTVEAKPGTWVGAGTPLANLTGPAQVVTVELDVRRRGDVSESSPVTVLLPDGTRVDGTVRSVGRVATVPGGAGANDSGQEGSGGDPTVRIEIEPSGLPEDLGLDAAQVVVIIERILAEDVLTVPVGALVARPGGDYAVERVDAARDPELVAVDPGQFADGLVEITGDIAERDEVVVPG